jgi:hypothetical protein
LKKKLPLPEKEWTEQEKWVWEKVGSGEAADFNEGDRYSGWLDPKKPEGWPENRILRPEFLETILLHEPYRGALTRLGVLITGARFKDPLDLINASLDHQLVLANSRFDSDLFLRFLNTPYSISLVGSKFSGKLNMDSLQVGSHLFIRNGAEFAEVDLKSAKIGGQLAMVKSKFSGKLNMNSLQVGSSLFMSDGAEFAEVDLGSARIGGTLEMNKSKFSGKLDMNSLQVKSHLFMRNSSFKKPVKLIFANIDGGLYLNTSSLSSIDLTGAKIKEEICLGSQKAPPSIWEREAKLTLRNTQVGALQDLEDSWPDKLELTGLTYSSLGGFGAGEGQSMADRDISWLKGWLKKQGHYSPQPYEQLAKVLRESGHKTKADEILYASKERERKADSGLHKHWLGFLKITIGYGFKPLYLLIWVFLFTLVGALVLKLFGEGPANNIPNYITYSLDMLLPIIRLDEFRYDAKFSLTYMGTIVQLYFYFQKVMGYVLVSVLIAGLSGITKK